MSNYTKSTNFASKDSLASGNPLKIVKGTEIDTEFNNIATAISTKADSTSPTMSGVTITSGTITGITDLAVADGGTGASTAADARTNLSAAKSGANSDITSLSGLTTALSVAQGGTGVTTSTGTGNVVLSNSPVLTGTPTAPTATAGDSSTKIATTAFVQNNTTSAVQAAYPVGSIYLNATDNTNPATLLGFGTWVAFGAGRMPVGFDSGDSSFNAAEKTGGSKDAIVVSHSHSITDPGHTHGVGYSTTVSAAGGVYAMPGASTNVTSTSSTTGISVNSTGSSGTNANLPPYITIYMWKRTA